MNVVFGSSPRGRGTVCTDDAIMICDRFIPAWAGNRPAMSRLHCRPAVHPRVGGEQTSQNLWISHYFYNVKERTEFFSVFGRRS